MSRPVDVLAVMDAFRCNGYTQVCCGRTQGGGMNENGDGEPPECCGQPFDNDDLLEARAAVAELVEAAGMALADFEIEGIELNHDTVTCLRAALAAFGAQP